MLKKLVAISLFLFFACVTAVMAAGLVVREINKQNTNLTANTGNNEANTVVPTDQVATNLQNGVSTPSTSDLVLNMAEVAKHSSANNCWMVISGKVYNVTDSIGSHPGGANEIIKFCGQDATVAFQTKDARGNDHSQAAYAMLAPYYVGNLNQKLTIQKATAPSSTSAPAKTTKSIPTIPPPTPAAPAADTALTAVELAKHNKANDCWLLISSKIYNVTSYIGSHPGGANEIIKFCGTDATTAFQTKDGRGNNHSQAAYAMLVPYYIGNLNQNITTQQLNTSVNQTNNTPPPTNSGEVDDD